MHPLLAAAGAAGRADPVGLAEDQAGYEAAVAARAAGAGVMSEKPIPPAAPAVYATMLPGLIEVARAHGYALAAHGSMARDFDLIAVPWVTDAQSPVALADALRDRLGGFYSQHDSNGIGLSKPHGRRCWVIQFGGGCYVDLSVMPRLEDDYDNIDGRLYVRLRGLEEDAPARPYD